MEYTLLLEDSNQQVTGEVQTIITENTVWPSEHWSNVCLEYTDYCGSVCLLDWDCPDKS